MSPTWWQLPIVWLFDYLLHPLAYRLGARPPLGSVWHSPSAALVRSMRETRRVATHTAISRRLITESSSADQLLLLALQDSERRLSDWCHWQALTLVGGLDATVQDDAYTFVRNQVLLLVEGWAVPEPWQWWRSRYRRTRRWLATRPRQAWRRYWQLVMVQPEPYREGQ